MPVSNHPIFVEQLAKETREFNQHGAHPGTELEWWYLTGHFWSEKGNPPILNEKSICETRYGFPLPSTNVFPDFAIQSTFFFSGQGANQGLLAQVAESNLKTLQHSFQQRAESFLPAQMRSLLGGVTAFDLDVRIANWKLVQLTKSSPLKWNLTQTVGDIQWELNLEPDASNIWLHGEKGYLEKVNGKGNFYSSFPFVKASGVRTELPTGQRTWVCGSLWFDHEVHVQAVEKVGWNWFAARFPDGHAYMIYQISTQSGQIKFAGEHFDANTHQSSALINVTIQPKGKVCLKSGACYMQSFEIEFLDTKTSNSKVLINLESEMAEQEMTGLSSLGKNYWEGAARAVRTTAPRGGKKTQIRETGYAFIELVPVPK